MKNNQTRVWLSFLVTLSIWTLVYGFLHLDYAEFSEFPYVVSIYNHTYVIEQTRTPQQYLNFICAGVLISVRHVLTAAHCFPNNQKKSLNLLVIASAVFKGGPDPSYKVKKLTIHEKYEKDKVNDLAVIELADPVSNYTGLYMVHQVKLPNKPPARDSLVYEIGWLPSEQQSLSPFLRKVRFKTLDSIKCGEQLGNRNIPANSGICIEEEGMSKCFGEVGSPLIQKGSKTNQDAVIGINMRGGMDTEGIPCDSGVHIHVAVYKYNDWIKSKTDMKGRRRNFQHE